MEKQEILDAVEVELFHVYGDFGKKKGRKPLEVPYLVMGFIMKAMKRLETPAPIAAPVPEPQVVAIDTWDEVMTFAQMEKVLVERALKKFDSRQDVAQALGISDRTLYRKMLDYGLYEKYKKHKK